MNRWIRWQGLVAFVVITASIFLFSLLFADGIVKRIIEKTGTAIVGAKVELDDADLSFLPLGLTLTRLQVTDSDEPMTNAVEISRIAFLMDSLNLLRLKVIIEEMTVDGMQFNTPRKKSGAISKRPKLISTKVRKTVTETLQLPSLEIPNVDEILKKEELRSMALAQALRKDIADGKEKWKKQLKDLPDKNKLKDYGKRLRKIRSSRKGGLGGILGGAADMIALRKEINLDLGRIKTARKDLKKERSALQTQWDKASKAPREDIRRLRDQYSLSPQGLSNISRILLGGPIGDWTGQLLRWHEKIEPALTRVAGQNDTASSLKTIRGKGIDVRYKEKTPLPDFLIRTALVSVKIPAGILKGKISNITPDQDVLGLPTTFGFSGSQMKDLQSIKIEGELNRVDPSRPRDRLDLLVRGIQLLGMNLSKSKDFPISLEKGTARFQIQAKLKGKNLDARISGHIEPVRILAGKKKETRPLPKIMAASLKTVKGFKLEADISGTLGDLDIRLTSDLDRILRKAVGKQVKAQTRQFEARLKSAISAKINKELAESKAELGGLTRMADELTNRLKLGDGLLKEAAGGNLGGLKLPF